MTAFIMIQIVEVADVGQRLQRNREDKGPFNGCQ